MDYKIRTRHNQGDTVFANIDGHIVEGKISAMHCLLRNDGTCTVYVAIDAGKKRYKKAKHEVFEECLVFKTPEEVAADMVRRFKEDKPIHIYTDSDDTKENPAHG